MNTINCDYVLDPPALVTTGHSSSLGYGEQRSFHPPPHMRLTDARKAEDNDPATLFLHNPLKRGQAWFINGPTGIGKSVLSIEAAMLFALGRPYLGFAPVRPLNVLLFLAEDDEDDVATMRDKIRRQHDLGVDDFSCLSPLVHVVYGVDMPGSDFVSCVVAAKCDELNPDIVFVNPVLAYVGGEAGNQGLVSQFLRFGLQPTLSKHKVAGFLIHHIPKPSRNKAQPNDAAYSGFGSVEWANWARGILTISSTSDRRLFKLEASKRGHLLGWKDAQGNATTTRYLTHTSKPDAYGWVDADPPSPAKRPSKKPKSDTPARLLALLEAGPLAKLKWQKEAEDRGIAKRAAFYKALKCPAIKDKWQEVNGLCQLASSTI